jgi:NAD(P) transhydrogenase subunit beta
MVEVLYLATAVAFIVGLQLLGTARTARTGNRIAASGMLAAIVITLVSEEIVDWVTVVAGLAVGAAFGAWFAIRVRMTAMPQLVAAFNGFGGLASALVAAVVVIEADVGGFTAETTVSVLTTITIGALTFSGSSVAFGKLQELLPGRPLGYPGQHVVNGLLTVALVGVATWAAVTDEASGYWTAGGLALAIGVLGVLPIGGADMPVVISLLNSLSGVAAAAAGFAIERTELIIGGALVGAAGLVLTVQMTEAMNRSLPDVLFAGFGSDAGAASAAAAVGERPVKRATADDVAIALAYARSVMIVPGYGLAVAQAQHAVRELADLLEARGCEVDYAIHPVAGRMPGHMNVLLAEADVPYEQLLDIDRADPMLPRTDVALVLGANDVVNPSARDDPSSAIYGMPILQVDRARQVVVVKRSLAPGFAGIDNPLFHDDTTLMLFADAKEALEDVITALDRS